MHQKLAKMSQILKITKKSCLKLFRKISPLRQSSLRKLEEEEEISIDNGCVPFSVGSNANHHTQHSYTNEALAPSNDQTGAESLNSVNKQFNTVQDYHIDTDSDATKPSKNDNAQGNTILQSLTSKLFLTADGFEFQRLQQLRSDTASEVLSYEPDFDENVIVFEKVKYNEDVRYFRRTPSTSSLDTSSHSEHIATPVEHLCSAPSGTQAVALVCDKPPKMATKHTPAPPAQVALRVPFSVTSLELRSEGKYQNVIITEQRDPYDKLTPIVKWDINGNSMDEDFFAFDNWNELDGNWNYVHDKRLAQFKLDNESQKSSFRSSSTTLETWLDEELLGQSFDESKHRQHFNLCPLNG